jgi:hypothetical protein
MDARGYADVREGNGSLGRSEGCRTDTEADRTSAVGAAFFCWALSTVVAWERRQYASRSLHVSSLTFVPRNPGRLRFAQTHQVRGWELELESAPSGRHEDGFVVEN